MWLSNVLKVENIKRHTRRLNLGNLASICSPVGSAVQHSQDQGFLWLLVVPTQSRFCAVYKHQSTNEHKSACSENEGLFICQQQQQRTEKPVLCSLITPICNYFPKTLFVRSAQSQKSYTTKLFISIIQHKSFLLLQCILAHKDHVLLAFRGRHPLCGTGVLSVIDTTSRPPIVRPLIADCRAEKNAFIH